MDDDADKSLSLAELKKGLHDYGIVDLEQDAIQNLFNEIDKDHSGSVSFDEFLKALRVSAIHTFIK